MGFKPSRRRKKPSYILDLNLVPLLSLFVALIPMLLLTAIFQNVGIINLYLPTLEEALLKEDPAETGADFTLGVVVTPEQLTLLKDDEVLMQDWIQGAPDLGHLSDELWRIKSEASGKRDAVLLLDPEIRYETIIEVMDAMREKDGRELFPDISLADRIAKEPL